MGKREYTIMTLDVVLGIIGGLSGLVWQGFGLIMGGYEEFKKDVSLLKSFYTIDKRTYNEDWEPEERNDHSKPLLNTIQDYIDSQ